MWNNGWNFQYGFCHRNTAHLIDYRQIKPQQDFKKQTKHIKSNYDKTLIAVEWMGKNGKKDTNEKKIVSLPHQTSDKKKNTL